MRNTIKLFALALVAAMPLSAQAQGHGRGRDKAPGQKCRAEGGTSNSRACRDRYGENQDRRDDGRWDRDDDRDERRDARRDARRGDTCLDRNRDGVCDDRTTRNDACADRNGDGYCDTGTATTTNGRACRDDNADGRCDGVWDRVIPGGLPTSTSSNGGLYSRGAANLPSMSLAQRWQNGDRSPTAREWLGTTNATVRYADRDRDGRIESATWYDRNGQVLQVWTDRDESGRADAVRIYQNGRLVRTVQ